MKSIPVLGIPFFNRPDLLVRLIDSIDHPIEKLVIVVQGPDGFTAEGAQKILMARNRKTTLISRVVIVKHPNAGVAGAWNEIIKLFPAAWWLISNNDIQFAPGDLGKMSATVEENIESGKRKAESENAVDPVAMFYGNHGASWFGITTFGVERVGLFDENIYPAYLEDCDWAHRADLLHARRQNVPGVAAIHGDEKLTGSCTINSDPMLRQKNGRTHGGNFEYYAAKWGGLNGQEKFSTPFNSATWPVWAWKFMPEFRARQQW